MCVRIVLTVISHPFLDEVCRPRLIGRAAREISADVSHRCTTAATAALTRGRSATPAAPTRGRSATAAAAAGLRTVDAGNDVPDAGQIRLAVSRPRHGGIEIDLAVCAF